jgi:hypothetical protein
LAISLATEAEAVPELALRRRAAGQPENRLAHDRPLSLVEDREHTDHASKPSRPQRIIGYPAGTPADHGATHYYHRSSHDPGPRA